MSYGDIIKYAVTKKMEKVNLNLEDCSKEGANQRELASWFWRKKITTKCRGLTIPPFNPLYKTLKSLRLSLREQIMIQGNRQSSLR